MYEEAQETFPATFCDCCSLVSIRSPIPASEHVASTYVNQNVLLGRGDAHSGQEETDFWSSQPGGRASGRVAKVENFKCIQIDGGATKMAIVGVQPGTGGQGNCTL